MDLAIINIRGSKDNRLAPIKEVFFLKYTGRMPGIPPKPKTSHCFHTKKSLNYKRIDGGALRGAPTLGFFRGRPSGRSRTGCCFFFGGALRGVPGLDVERSVEAPSGAAPPWIFFGGALRGVPTPIPSRVTRSGGLVPGNAGQTINRPRSLTRKVAPNTDFMFTETNHLHAVVGFST